MAALKIGGWINLLIGALHVLAIVRMREVANWIGASAEMDRAAEMFVVLPHLLTLVAGMVFVAFGVYALSAAGAIGSLWGTTPAIVAIAVVYLLRALGGFGAGGFLEDASLKERIFSGIALVVGCLYSVGAYRLLTAR
jgi:hypothetical protein